MNESFLAIKVVSLIVISAMLVTTITLRLFTKTINFMRSFAKGEFPLLSLYISIKSVKSKNNELNFFKAWRQVYKV